MSESNDDLLTKDPSLKRYFKYMLVNRKMSVQFTSKKIREIVENDLDIKLETNSMYSKMCIDAFAYYMQSWPEWHLAVKSIYTDEWYDSLRNFLKTKLLNLKKRGSNTLTEKMGHNLALPDNINPDHMFAGNSITLNINIPEKLWNKTEIAFKSGDGNDLVLELKKIQKTSVQISDSDIINHPYVSIEFNVPGLIHIERSSPFKIVRFLHFYKVSPVIESELIHSITQTNVLPNPKVYTHRLLNSFFNKLKNILETNYSTAVDLVKRTEILTFCDEFLSDIFEANVCKATVCEGYNVEFNMSRRSYFLNSLIEQKMNKYCDNMLIYKKVLIPIISYSLKCCSLQQEDITRDGCNFFKFLGDIDKTFETAFLHYLINSVTYKCILCGTYFILYELKQHLKTNHPLEESYQCSRCFKNLPVELLLQLRWNHECSVILSNVIT